MLCRIKIIFIPLLSFAISLYALNDQVVPGLSEQLPARSNAPGDQQLPAYPELPPSSQDSECLCYDQSDTESTEPVSGSESESESEEDSWLITAVAAANIEQLRRLVGQNFNIDSRDDAGRTPLIHAILHGNQGIITLLIRYGADVLARDCYNRDPLQYTIEYYRSGDLMRITTLLRCAPFLLNDQRVRTILGERWGQ